jgi:hypothetical protein
MKKTIAVIIALLLSMVNTNLVEAKANKKKSAKRKAKKSVYAKKPKATTKVNNAKPKQAPAHKPQPAPQDEKSLKDETQEWDQRKKAMEPLQLKELIEENHKLKIQKRDLDTYIQDLELRLKYQQQTAEKLHKIQTEQEKLYIAGAGNTPRDPEDLIPGSYTVDLEKGQVFIHGILDNRYGIDKKTGKPFIKGVIFKVQVSADKDLDLSDVLIDDSHHTNLEQEKDNNLNKYTIGHFRNYWEADKLKKGLRKMGIKWAWIVPYKDGKRVLLKEVLSTVIATKKQ